MLTTRAEVYRAIDTERDYQEFRWSDSTTHHNHSLTEWLVYIRDYTEEALHILSREADPVATEKALPFLRKIAPLGVAGMEQLGAPLRAE